MKNVLYIILLIFLASCKKNSTPVITTIEGTVINTGSRQPIDSVKVTVVDGRSGGDSFFGNIKTSGSGKIIVKYTGTDGKFSISIEGTSPVLYLEKTGYEFVVFSAGYGSSDYFKSYKAGEKYKNEVLELWADSYFKPILKSKDQPYDDDNLWIVSLPYFTESKYDIYEDMYHFVGKGPFLYNDYNGAIGDMYKKFKIKLIRNGITTEHKDSVFVKSLSTYTDTIYY